MSNLEKLLTQRLAEAFRQVAGTAVDPLVHRSRRADYQADGALALGRQLGRSPGVIASEVLSQAHLSDICVVAESAAPGFINLTMSDDFLDEQVTLMVADERLGVAIGPQPEVVVVDYSGPNAAKEMHVGHLHTDPIRVGAPSERRLVLELLAFEGVIDQVEETLEPHRLCGYLYSLANAFTGFYENCPVLKSHGDLRSSRLALCRVTARTLALGLDLLGIAAPDRM
ncbi:MAG: arginine--tRNA ligase [Acidimicrobiales bacterium]